MLRAYVRQDDRLVASDLDVTAVPPEMERAVWYNLTDPTKAEDQFVESCLGIDIPTRAEMDDIEPSARLYNEDESELILNSPEGVAGLEWLVALEHEHKVVVPGTAVKSSSMAERCAAGAVENTLSLEFWVAQIVPFSA